MWQRVFCPTLNTVRLYLSNMNAGEPLGSNEIFEAQVLPIAALWIFPIKEINELNSAMQVHSYFWQGNKMKPNATWPVQHDNFPHEGQRWLHFDYSDRHTSMVFIPVFSFGHLWITNMKLFACVIFRLYTKFHRTIRKLVFKFLKYRPPPITALSRLMLLCYIFVHEWTWLCTIYFYGSVFMKYIIDPSCIFTLWRTCFHLLLFNKKYYIQIMSMF